MTWLIRRLLILWLIFCIVCAAAIALGRLDHTPTTLQTLGFDTCDGEPCFRGLKIGANWAKVQSIFPMARLYLNYGQFTINISGKELLTASLTKDRSIYWMEMTPRKSKIPILLLPKML